MEKQVSQELQDRMASLQSQINDLSSQFYKNNFTSTQTFIKASEFTTAVKLPIFTNLPNCEIGNIAIYQHDYGSGVRNNLVVGTAVNTWTVVGTQTAA